MQVHIVGWFHEGGGGFDWYYSREDADEAYSREAPELTALGLTVYRHEHETKLNNRAAITREIDGDLYHFEDTATVRARKGGE